jgi:hypothetical protein
VVRDSLQRLRTAGFVESSARGWRLVGAVDAAGSLGAR